jgi:transcriptional regulator with XRE-family HTH domain
MNKIFCQRLKALRASKGFSQAKLASSLEIHAQVVSDYERGKSTPSFAVLEKMSDIFECPVDYLMGRDNIQFTVHEEPPKWLSKIMPDLARLDSTGQEAVKALIKGFKK